MPFLPFPVEEVLVPGMTKDLHLYEPRYLELLKEVMSSCDREFVHVVLEPPSSRSAITPGAFVADGVAVCYPVIVRISESRELSVGTMVRIQAMQRASVSGIEFAGPSHQGTVAALPDITPSAPEVKAAILRLLSDLQGLVADVSLLYAKLPKCPEAAQLRRALQWVDVMEHLRMSPDDKDVVRAQRLSYAALVPPSSPTEEDLSELQERRLLAMGTQDSEMRLKNAIEWLQHVRAGLSARLALSALSVQMPPDASQA